MILCKNILLIDKKERQITIYHQMCRHSSHVETAGDKMLLQNKK